MDIRGFIGTILEREPETAAEWAQRGDQFLGSDRLEDAVVFYERALALDPDNLQALRGKACAARRMGDLGGAKEIYHRILTIAPDDRWILLALGYVHSVDGEVEKAVQCFDRVLETDPKNITAKALRFFSLSEGSSDRERLELVRKIENDDPDFISRLAEETVREVIIADVLGIPQGDKVLLTGDALYKTRDIRAFEEALPRIVQSGRTMLRDFSPDGAFDLTDIKTANNIPDPDALFRADTAKLEKLLKRQPATATEWFEKGDHLCRNADHGLNLENEARQELYREAGLCFDQVCSLSPPEELMTLGWLGKGYAALRLGRYSEALSSFDEAVRISPNDVAGLKGRAYALSNLGQAQDAGRCFEKVQEIQDKADPHHAFWMTERTRGYIVSKLVS